MKDNPDRPNSARHDALIGKTVSHYKVLDRLGHGGMGVVYTASDLRLGRKVALKFLPPREASTEVQRKRFIQEATTASSLDHPNICTIFEIGESKDGRMFIVMAYYEGQTLRHKIAAGPLAVHIVLDVAAQLASGLAKAHEHGIVHRDIKPSNLIITNDHILKILDFGVARVSGSNLTSEGEAVGTLAYMSPEQVSGEPVDHRTDIWSAAAVMYEMVTGLLPFAADSARQVLSAIVTQPPRDVTSLRRGVPPELTRIIRKGLSKHPDHRHSDARELLADLRTAMRSTVSHASWVEETATVPVPTSVLRSTHGSSTAPGTHTTTNGSAPFIAVLPFENRSSDRESEFFSDGLTEDLIHALAQVPGLRVVSRTSAFAFKGKPLELHEIGTKLQVNWVVEGSVQTVGKRVRIIVRLTNVDDNALLWSERFDRNLEDVFAVQDEIARTIVEVLQVRLNVSQQGRQLVRPYDVEAYQLYLRGRFHWNKHSATGLQKAVECFEQVLATDPTFAPAHSGLADYYSALAFYSALPPYELWPKARVAAEAALHLDERLAEAHLSLGYVSLFHDWDRGAAEYRVRLALQLNPGAVNAHLFHSMLLIQEGKLTDALKPAKRARSLDPLSPAVDSFVAAISVYSGCYDEAIRSATNMLDIEPGNIDLVCMLGLAYQHKGLIAKATETFERAQGQAGMNHLFTGLLGNCYAAAGRPEDARQLLEQFHPADESGYVPYGARAMIRLGLGENEAALELLEQSAHARETLVHYIKVLPTFSPLRESERYEALLAKLGLSGSAVLPPPGSAG